MCKYKINQIIKCKINSIKAYGMFVYVDEVYTGLIHISEINGKYIKNINDYYQVGNIINAKIIEVSDEKKQLRLSIIGVKNNFSSNTKLMGTTLGFELFDEILQDWIDEKMAEIKKINNIL